jgi:hypothetical protein
MNSRNSFIMTSGRVSFALGYHSRLNWPLPLRLGPDHLKGRMKIGVTERAVVKRLKRALLTKGQYLRVADGRKQKRWGFGRYYLLDAKGVVDKDVNIERMARQLGVVVPREVTSATAPAALPRWPRSAAPRPS